MKMSRLRTYIRGTISLLTVEMKVVLGQVKKGKEVTALTNFI